MAEIQSLSVIQILNRFTPNVGATKSVSDTDSNRFTPNVGVTKSVSDTDSVRFCSHTVGA